MSASGIEAIAVRQGNNGWRRYFSGHWLRFVVDLATLPLLLRRRMTGSSATLLIVWIASLNIVWQFPFLGLFGASLSILVIAAIVNTAIRPVIDVDATLPQIATAGETFMVNFSVRSARRIPAFSLELALDRGRRIRHASTERIASIDWLGNTPVSIVTPLTAQRRGRQSIPDLQIISHFPFAVWRIFSIARVDASILVTPDPSLRDAPAAVTRMRSEAVRWIDSKRQDDASEYAGSREYVLGQTVRQWDFRAWSRLNRPMVRIPPRGHGGQTTLIIDPAIDSSASQTFDPERRYTNVEWLLRVASSIIEDPRGGLELCMFIAGPQTSLRQHFDGHLFDADPATQLALAEAYDADSIDGEVDPQTGAVRRWLPVAELERARRTNVLVLTTRHNTDQVLPPALAAKVIRLVLPDDVDAAEVKRVKSKASR